MPSYLMQTAFSPLELRQYKIPARVLVTVEAELEDVTPQMKEAMQKILYDARFGIYRGHETHEPQKTGGNDA